MGDLFEEIEYLELETDEAAKQIENYRIEARKRGPPPEKRFRGKLILKRFQILNSVAVETKSHLPNKVVSSCYEVDLILKCCYEHFYCLITYNSDVSCCTNLIFEKSSTLYFSRLLL